MYKKYFKRCFDVVLSVCSLIVLSPFLIIITFWLHYANKGGGAFFCQKRPGKGSKIFTVIKFKTMTDERDANGLLLPDEVRLSKAGKFLRSMSIDELPQLINIIKGDMSLIGPRPLIMQYLPLYSNDHARRHEVRPGITGWAQVNGRDTVKFSKRFDYDVWYVDHLNLKLDIKIVFLTFQKVLTSEGFIIDQDLQDIDDLNFNPDINYDSK